MRRAKIVATFGPAIADYDKAKAVIEAGVDVARMNLSHGSHEVHEAVYATIRNNSLSHGDRPAMCSANDLVQQVATTEILRLQVGPIR